MRDLIYEGHLNVSHKQTNKYKFYKNEKKEDMKEPFFIQLNTIILTINETGSYLVCLFPSAGSFNNFPLILISDLIKNFYFSQNSSFNFSWK